MSRGIFFHYSCISDHQDSNFSTMLVDLPAIKKESFANVLLMEFSGQVSGLCPQILWSLLKDTVYQHFGALAEQCPCALQFVSSLIKVDIVSPFCITQCCQPLLRETGQCICGSAEFIDWVPIIIQFLGRTSMISILQLKGR